MLRSRSPGTSSASSLLLLPLLLGSACDDTEAEPAPDVELAAAPLGEGWTAIDVGAVGAAGRCQETAGTDTLEGAGADIWAKADGFRFVRGTLTLSRRG